MRVKVDIIRDDGGEWVVEMIDQDVSVEDYNKSGFQERMWRVSWERLAELLAMDAVANTHGFVVGVLPAQPIKFEDIKKVKDAWDFFTFIAPRGTRISGQLMRQISMAIYGERVAMLGWERVDDRDEWRRDRPDDDMGLLGGA